MVSAEGVIKHKGKGVELMLAEQAQENKHKTTEDSKDQSGRSHTTGSHPSATLDLPTKYFPTNFLPLLPLEPSINVATLPLYPIPLPGRELMSAEAQENKDKVRELRQVEETQENKGKAVEDGQDQSGGTHTTGIHPSATLDPPPKYSATVDPAPQRHILHPANFLPLGTNKLIWGLTVYIPPLIDNGNALPPDRTWETVVHLEPISVRRPEKNPSNTPISKSLDDKAPDRLRQPKTAYGPLTMNNPHHHNNSTANTRRFPFTQILSNMSDSGVGPLDRGQWDPPA
jgi:hypothetical protein